MSRVLAIYGVYLAAAVSPGPAVLFVMRTALGSGRFALPAALGVATGTALWVGVAALGLSAVLKGMPALIDAIRLAGGAYFLYLCAGLARSAASSAAAETASGFSPPSARAAYARGVATNVTNPATALFFTGLFSLYDVGEMPLGARSAVYLGIPALSVCWYCGLSLLFSNERLSRAYLSLRRPLDGALCVLFLVLAAKLLLAVFPRGA